MQPTQDEITAVTKAVRRVLGPYGLKPSAEEISSLTQDVITHGRRYVARAQGIRHAHRVSGALQDWDALTTCGPEDDDPLGDWNHLRALARVVRILHNALLEEGERLKFVGRATLPPFAEGAL